MMHSSSNQTSPKLLRLVKERAKVKKNMTHFLLDQKLKRRRPTFSPGKPVVATTGAEASSASATGSVEASSSVKVGGQVIELLGETNEVYYATLLRIYDQNVCELAGGIKYSPKEWYRALAKLQDPSDPKPFLQQQAMALVWQQTVLELRFTAGQLN
jgi:hypothetical protein